MKKKYKIALLVSVSLVVLAIATHDTPEQKEAKYLRKGNELFEKGEYRKARLEYKNAAKIKPADPEIAYRWGLVDEAEGDIRGAFVDFSQAEQQNPHFHAAVLKVAHYHLVVSNIAETQKRVDSVLADDPNNAEAHALQAALLLRKKDFDATEREARESLAKDPTNITAISVLAGMYLAQKDIEKAGDIVNEGIKRNPDDLSLLTLKARLYEKPLNLEKIDEAYQAIFKLKPKETQFRVYLANTYLDAHKVDEAENVLRQGVAALPADWSLKRELVIFLDAHRSQEVAEKEVHDYMKAYPEYDDLTFWLVDLYLKHDNVEKAVAELEKIVSKDDSDKQSLNARTSLARINFTKGHQDLAEKMVDAVLKKAPHNREALYIRANIAASTGLYQNAVSDLRLILHDQPQAKDALQLMAEILLTQGYTDLAIETLNQLLDIDPTDSVIRVRLAEMNNLNGDSKRAIELLNMVTKTAPDYAVGWENLARVAIDRKDYKLAQSAIASLDKLDGQHLTAVFLGGQIAALNNKYDDARVAFTKVIDADPATPLAAHALYALATLHNSPQELEKSIQYMASLKTDNAYVNTVLGESYLQQGKTSLAEAAFTKAIANHPNNQDAYTDLAKIYVSQNKSDDAIAVLKQAATAFPSNITAVMQEADILRATQNWDEAIAIYDEILKFHPENNIATNNMASMIADHLSNDPSMLDKARKAAERFAGSSVPYELDTLGWVYYKQGKYDQAIMLLSRAITNDVKGIVEFHYHYGAALLKAGKTDQAKNELKLATPENADYPELGTAKEMLLSIKN